MQDKPVITLISDFGLEDSYVAEMKGVILSICPKATIIDICHEIKKFNIRMGAFILSRAALYFPAGAIHVAVVDPGVGTERRPIIVQTQRSYYVGPDNGLLILAAQLEGIKHIYEIANPQYMLSKVSRTFHGRDVFSPAAAYLALGIPPSDFGPQIQDSLVPKFASPRIQESEIRGEVIHIDGFGNIITNITPQDLKAIEINEGNNLLLTSNGEELRLQLASSYEDAPRGSLLAIIGGTGLLEVSASQGNASKVIGMKIGDDFRLRTLSPKLAP